jgi:hypothetical protein
VSEPFRGRTFSPAEDWQAGGTDFALWKLLEVNKFLWELVEQLPGRRPWWRTRRSWLRQHQQRIWDLQDAARTCTDAAAKLRWALRGDFSIEVEVDGRHVDATLWIEGTPVAATGDATGTLSVRHLVGELTGMLARAIEERRQR